MSELSVPLRRVPAVWHARTGPARVFDLLLELGECVNSTVEACDHTRKIDRDVVSVNWIQECSTSKAMIDEKTCPDYVVK